MLSRLYAWLDSRLKLEPVKETLLDEPIPGGASWIYVFGSATLFLFFLQAITGMFLAVYYAPTPDHAYDSIRYIETQVLFGPFVRGLHHWGPPRWWLPSACTCSRSSCTARTSRPAS